MSDTGSAHWASSFEMWSKEYFHRLSSPYKISDILYPSVYPFIFSKQPIYAFILNKQMYVFILYIVWWYLTPLSTKFSYIVASVLLMGETGRSGENHQPIASHWQTLSYNVVHLALIEIRTQTSVVIGTDWICSCKSNYHAITPCGRFILYKQSICA